MSHTELQGDVQHIDLLVDPRIEQLAATADAVIATTSDVTSMDESMRNTATELPKGFF
ncbi:hypothetical protein NW762_006917 [Fusarium torreyae]|uniref:Uncharacterized protein n=1 Tax=Fusarium torreyae TaxID=1237075 RepID=A0A9W8RYF8_9HYPO|nr:hypothetical protein NW762_006917 [Fusarium torreyae]